VIDASFLAWPFFEDRHRHFARDLTAWAENEIHSLVDHHDVDASCRRLVRRLGETGWLRAAVPQAYGGLYPNFDVRTLCLARETLAYRDGLADFAFAMQGLGTGPVTLFGSDAMKQRYLPPVARGEALAAFALSEPEAGSDVADMVDADTSGLAIENRIDVIAPHPLATLRFEGCRVPLANRIGGPGEGFKVAMATLDVFRSTVGAAALGLARRALDEALRHASSRRLFGAPLSDLQMTQGALADMATAVDAAALLVYRSAWTKDGGAARVTREAAMAKMQATEAAQGVIDKAVQIFGGLGVTKGVKVEELYREIRALRIYEGATEVQKIVIARELLKMVETQRPGERQ
jgi:acyl-CoA dehydrogenase